MRKQLSRIIILASTLVLPLTAHASTIDDFVLSGGGHTITYSLPGTSTFPDFSLFNFFSETAPATVDGTSGYTLTGLYYDTGIFPYVSLALSVPNTVSEVGQLVLSGPAFISFAFEPAIEPPPYLQEEVVPTFIAGTYSLHTVAGPTGPILPSVPYTLTITEQDTVLTPEPSTLVLLGTGVSGLIGFAGIKNRRTALS